MRTDPIQHSEFLKQPEKRQRYWARSYAGWPHVQTAEPNATHRALARLEDLGYINQLVTQNVDRLHQRSGQKNVVDLHGRLDQVHCTECYAEYERAEIQAQLKQLNPHLTTESEEIAPDGDADVPDTLVARVKTPDCAQCGGILKPSVVFYGGGVAKQVVQGIYSEMQNSRGVFVVGSSLMVFSSFRFCRFAKAQNIPIGILNPGKTRADDLASIKLSRSAEEVLPQLVHLLETDAK